MQLDDTHGCSHKWPLDTLAIAPDLPLQCDGCSRRGGPLPHITPAVTVIHMPGAIYPRQVVACADRRVHGGSVAPLVAVAQTANLGVAV